MYMRDIFRTLHVRVRKVFRVTDLFPKKIEISKIDIDVYLSKLIYPTCKNSLAKFAFVLTDKKPVRTMSSCCE